MAQASSQCQESLVQVCEHLQRVGKVCGIWAVPIVGGISPVKQERLLKKAPEVSCLQLSVFSVSLTSSAYACQLARPYT